MNNFKLYLRFIWIKLSCSMAFKTDLSSKVRSKCGETRGAVHSLCHEWSVLATLDINIVPTWNSTKKTSRKFVLVINYSYLLTCRNAELSVSLRASMQNWSNAVVCCSLEVHVATCSLRALTRTSLSCRIHSMSLSLLAWMARINASHCADTICSNSSQFS